MTSPQPAVSPDTPPSAAPHSKDEGKSAHAAAEGKSAHAGGEDLSNRVDLVMGGGGVKEIGRAHV